tara:strand:- start:91 stop:321 length:231 start_codon:yes stop_codon:yes gene_type:complete
MRILSAQEKKNSIEYCMSVLEAALNQARGKDGEHHELVPIEVFAFHDEYAQFPHRIEFHWECSSLTFYNLEDVDSV